MRRRNAGELPMIGDPDRKVADPSRHDSPQRQRHAHRSFRLRDRSRQEGEAHHHLPGQHRPQLDEILRVIDSPQLTAGYKVATPVNWTDGDDVIIGSAVTNEEAEKLFPQGWKTIKPYLRLPQPKK